MLTATTAERDLLPGLRSGADEYRSKPTRTAKIPPLLGPPLRHGRGQLLTARATRGGDSAGLSAEVSRYTELYGTAVEIRDRDGRQLAGGGSGHAAA
ncbi:hypothetical protein, partial [Saccharothrix sp. ST-888]|uniref:hypothetical protein n=1 Tax=Saccharothrix sp. ST-888 TaxID=1427391 RepID=UPI0005ECCB94